MVVAVNTKTHTDIKPEGWFINRLPSSVLPYALLARIDRPVGIWLLLLPGWWSVVLAAGGVTRMNGNDWKIFLLFGLGAIVMRAAGCVVNDLWDRNLDRQVERTRARPIASGAVSARRALMFLFMVLLVGFGILMQMNLMTVLLGIISLPLIVIYPLMKRFTWWPQAFLGLTFNFGALMGWSAVTGEISSTALLLYAGGIFWTLGYDTIYAHQDKEDDALAGIKSTALKFGEHSKKIVSGFFIVTWILIALSAGLHYLLFLLPAAAHLFWQIQSWKPQDAVNSLRIFRANRDFGLFVLFALAI
jgi:4-hydroxybenzoate polyprenyltransferase